MQHETFSRACTTAKDRNQIRRAKQSIERLALLVIKLWVGRLRIQNERPAVADAFLGGLNNLPLTQQHVALG